VLGEALTSMARAEAAEPAPVQEQTAPAEGETPGESAKEMP
jgi:hypothetical protein